MDLKSPSVYQGQPKSGKADCTLTLADEDMVQIVSMQTTYLGLASVINRASVV